jgi:hypothetical protein
MTQLYACGYIAELQLFHTKDRFAPLIKLPVICANKFRFTFLRLRFIQYESLSRKLYKSYISLSVSSWIYIYDIYTMWLLQGEIF